MRSGLSPLEAQSEQGQDENGGKAQGAATAGCRADGDAARIRHAVVGDAVSVICSAVLDGRLDARSGRTRGTILDHA